MRDDSVAAALLPSPRNARSILRVVGWNLLFILAGFLLIGAVGEAYFRMIGRFGNGGIDLASDPAYSRFVPGVGLLRPPHVELTLSNGLNYWTVQRTNSLGFLDREPIDPARAADSCHISIIGDSFVEAKEVPISYKLQVRLEEIAARDAPHLDVTTSAFGFSGTGQVNQLPFYDRYVRRMSPDMVVLVFVANDPHDNSTERYALRPGYVPDRMAHGQASRDGDGEVIWIPPVINFSDTIYSRATESMNSWNNRIIYQMAQLSYFMRWLGVSTKLIGRYSDLYVPFLPSDDVVRRYQEWMNLVAETATSEEDVKHMESWGFTSLGLEQFKRRADRDGVVLAILTNHDSGGGGYPQIERLSAIAESLDIPVVIQRDYIRRQGGRMEDAHWDTDFHWTSAGHQWAAEAIWEYIEEEWHGQCPQVEPRKDVEVEWIPLDAPTREGESDSPVLVFQKPFGLHHRFHTPDGRVWVQNYPTFDSEGYRSVYEFVRYHHPAVRSDWHVHLYDQGLTYVKEPCTDWDVENRFFLHVFPADAGVLTANSRSRGSKNLDFHFGFRGVTFDGICMVSVDLPEYEIARISTGQYVAGIDSEDSLVWGAHYNLDLPEIIAAVKKLQGSGLEPEIRSNFDVYINDGRLTYVKDSCTAHDRDLPFFLHVFPADETNLPAGRDESGFDNLGFKLMQKGGMHDGGCFAAVDLPEYEIEYIMTGQFSEDVQTWRGGYNFDLPSIMDAVRDLQQSGIEPDIRSDFDVYIHDDQLIYVRESCTAHDRDLPFFLHVFPADDRDLPAGREESGFDNLGFELVQKGGMHDDGCFAAVDLPKYEMSSIRTGQFVRGEAHVWEANIDFAK